MNGFLPIIGVGIPDPGGETVHHVAGGETTANNMQSPSEPQASVSTSEKMQQVGTQMQKAGLNMTACGCSVVILVIIGSVLHAVSCGH